MSVDPVEARILGVRAIDARAEWIGASDGEGRDSTTFALRIDGTWFAWREDPADGMRSSCRDPLELPVSSIPRSALAEFAPRVVTIRNVEQGHYLVTSGLDEATNAALFHVGTDLTDHCYPRFIASWTPPAS